jgi:diaminopropionate ammonia-lyase
MPATGPADWIRNERDPAWSCPPVPPEVRAFHRTLTGYRPTPLVALPAMAAELGVARVLVKDETERLGLPAFKALGASWAMHRALVEAGRAPGDGPAGRPVTFVTATDGNHGRAVARLASRLGHGARILVPDGVPAAAVAAIEAEGASVDHVRGTYDDAVAAAARLADALGGVLVQDTAWPGYERIPAWIVEGYATLFAELEAQLDAIGAVADLLVVPAGVGSLAQAAVTHARSRPDPARSAVVTVEPDTAAGVLASLRAGRAVTVPTRVTSMAGLNCGTPSSLAWPVLRAGLDGAVAITDADAAAAAAPLRASGVDAGPCGWAALAGARAVLAGEGAGDRRAALGVGRGGTVVLVATEGAAANPR